MKDKLLPRGMVSGRSMLVEGTQPYKVRTGCGHIVIRRMREATAGVPFTEDTILAAPNGRPCEDCEADPLLGQLARGQFNSYESGKIIAGIKHAILTDLGLESHDCYQFDTLEDIKKEAHGLIARGDVKSVEIVTHQGQYKGMRTLWKWAAQGEEK